MARCPTGASWEPPHHGLGQHHHGQTGCPWALKGPACVRGAQPQRGSHMGPVLPGDSGQRPGQDPQTLQLRQAGGSQPHCPQSLSSRVPVEGAVRCSPSPGSARLPHTRPGGHSLPLRGPGPGGHLRHTDLNVLGCVAPSWVLFTGDTANVYAFPAFPRNGPRGSAQGATSGPERTGRGRHTGQPRGRTEAQAGGGTGGLLYSFIYPSSSSSEDNFLLCLEREEESGRETSM